MSASHILGVLLQQPATVNCWTLPASSGLLTAGLHTVGSGALVEPFAAAVKARAPELLSNSTPGGMGLQLLLFV